MEVGRGGGGGEEEEEEEEGEVLFSNTSHPSLHLDTLIGHVEDIILSEEFVNLRESFLQVHCHMFEDEEENKLAYTDVYREYLKIMEGYLEEELKQREPGLQISSLLHALSSSSSSSSSSSFSCNGFDGEVFEMLSTLTDFLAFKREMLDFKKSEEDQTSELSDLLQVTSLKS